jgi:hypothetical protein
VLNSYPHYKNEETIWNLYLNGDNASIEEIHKLYAAKLVLCDWQGDELTVKPLIDTEQ